ncbi:MAG: hypothetical protein LBI69_04725 [Puniceicoccales bacterium]|nr:hypothetical protein [Puniceicoccales bacterium]
MVDIDGVKGKNFIVASPSSPAGQTDVTNIIFMKMKGTGKFKYCLCVEDIQIKPTIREHLEMIAVNFECNVAVAFLMWLFRGFFRTSVGYGRMFAILAAATNSPAERVRAELSENKSKNSHSNEKKSNLIQGSPSLSGQPNEDPADSGVQLLSGGSIPKKYVGEISEDDTIALTKSPPFANTRMAKLYKVKINGKDSVLKFYRNCVNCYDNYQISHEVIDMTPNKAGAFAQDFATRSFFSALLSQHFYSQGLDEFCVDASKNSEENAYRIDEEANILTFGVSRSCSFAMPFREGVELTNFAAMGKNVDMAAGNHIYNDLKVKHIVKLIKEASELQILDFISGQMDRNLGNILINFKDDKIEFAGIDNDLCLPSASQKMGNDLSMRYIQACTAPHFPYITKNFKAKLDQLDAASLSKMLTDAGRDPKITQYGKELQFMNARLSMLKDFYGKNNSYILDNDGWGNANAIRESAYKLYTYANKLLNQCYNFTDTVIPCGELTNSKLLAGFWYELERTGRWNALTINGLDTKISNIVSFEAIKEINESDEFKRDCNRRTVELRKIANPYLKQ